MSQMREVQIERNRISRELWPSFAAHRAQVAQRLVSSASPAGGRLCVLGAGNCNDLDLKMLWASFAEIHLADLDAQALRDGVARQAISSDGIYLYGETDVTGAWDSIERIASEGADESALTNLLAALDTTAALSLPGPFDCVASIGLLSQLIDSVAGAFGAGHLQVNEAVLAIRDQHLRRLADLTAPGGTAWLITDFVSSDTCAELLTIADEGLPSLASRLLQAGNFFTGLNPLAVANQVAADPVLAGRFAAPQIGPPWRWRLGPRAFAVFAMQLQRK